MVFFKQHGFTLIELLITLMIAGVLAAAAAPSFMRTIDSNRVTTAVNEFSASLSYAKSEAVKHNRGVKLVSNNNDWEQGYSIGIDLNGDNDFNDTVTISGRDVTEQTLKEVAAVSSNVTITSALTVIETNSLGGLSNTGSIVFDSSRYACKRTLTLVASGVSFLTKEQEPCS